jgi:hypothetical protein
MNVKKYQIRYDKTTNNTAINIPVRLDFIPVDNSELIEDKFVSDEIEKAINPITDYKKVRFKPAVINGNQWVIIDEFKLQLVMFNDTPTYTSTPTNYGEIGFTDADVFCRANKLMKSFLTLSFFDSNNEQNNRLLFFNRIYTQIGDDQKEETGQVKESNEVPMSFRIGDPTLKPESVHEGFHLYWYQDLVDNAPNKEYVTYVTATYSNAMSGSTSALYTQPTQNINNIQISDINGPNGGLFLKCILKNDNGVYKYTFEKLNTQTGVDWNIQLPGNQLVQPPQPLISFGGGVLGGGGPGGGGTGGSGTGILGGFGPGGFGPGGGGFGGGGTGFGGGSGGNNPFGGGGGNSNNNNGPLPIITFYQIAPTKQT